jgi:hypothetical protein
MRNGTYFYTPCEESASFFRDINSINFYGKRKYYTTRFNDISKVAAKCFDCYNTLSPKK